MKNQYLNVLGIQLDANGRTVLGDEQLRQLETSFSAPIMAGGANDRCTNTANCSGSTNTTQCTNRTRCDNANNTEVCRGLTHAV